MLLPLSLSRFLGFYKIAEMPGKIGKSAKLLAAAANQKSLLTYFKNDSFQMDSEVEKHLKVEIEGEPESSPVCKRLKLMEEESVVENVVPISVLSPEQRRMIERKRLAASILKTSKVLEILDTEIGHSWFAALESEFKKDYFVELSKFVQASRAKGTVYPPHGNVWEWTKRCEINDVKVVILGQDPYHGPKQAHGLCFSVQKGVPPPPSLVNIYKELEKDFEGFNIPGHGYLDGWAKQGVLLLNAVLTVEAGKANSHKDKGWEKLTDAVISWISKNLNSVVFLLWGSYAQKKAAIVDKKRHHLLQAVHPSPLSAHRGFFGCQHFSKCNELLIKNGKEPIDWNAL